MIKSLSYAPGVRARLAGYGLDRQVQEHFASWAKEDTYRPLFEEFEALAAAGFRSPQCFWKQGAIGVYGGIK